MKQTSRITQAGKSPGGIYRPLTVSEKKYVNESLNSGRDFEKAVKADRIKRQIRGYY